MGSMMRDLRTLDQYRLNDGLSMVPAREGMFEVRSPVMGILRVIAAADMGWDHVSVSAPNRAPTWSEMEHVKRMFFFDNATCYQLHVPVSSHLSIHPNVLHIWHPWDQAIPMPPIEMV